MSHPLPPDEIDRLHALDGEERRVETKSLVQQIHIAVHNGAVDRRAVDEALAKLTVLYVVRDEPKPELAPLPEPQPLPEQSTAA